MQTSQIIEPIELNQEQAITLDRIISTVLRKIEFITLSTLPTPDARQLNAYVHLHDVLEIHNYRNNPDMQALAFQRTRPWNTEMDIPLDEYIQAIDLAIEMLSKTYHQPITQIIQLVGHTKERKQRFESKIALLNLLKSHRTGEDAQ